ncbi:MAG: MFS transporter [Anaerolineales bacterium]
MQLLDKRLVTILMIVLVQMIGASMALPILPLYAKRQFDLSPEVITLLISIFFAAQFLAGPIIGRLSDHYGRLPVLIISQLGTIISFAMLGLAPSPAWLFVARVLDGITGGNIIVAQAYVTDITPREQRTQALGYVFAAFGVGFIIGPALGGVLAALFGERMPFLIAALAALLTVLLTVFTLDESLSPEQKATNQTGDKRQMRPRQVLSNFPLVLILLVSFVSTFGLGLLQATFALFGEAVLFAGDNEQTTNLGIGLLLAMVGFGQVFTQTLLLGRLLKRFDEGVLIVLGLGLRMVSMFGLVVALSPFVAAPATLFFAVGGGILLPPLQSMATNTVGEHLRGGVLGLYQSSRSLATIISTALGGTLFAITPTAPYWLSAVLFGASLVPAIYLMRWAQAHATSSPEVASAATD